MAFPFSLPSHSPFPSFSPLIASLPSLPPHPSLSHTLDLICDMARYSSSFYQPPPTSNAPQTPPLLYSQNPSHQPQINISTQNGVTTTISLQQPQLQVHFSIGETQGHTQQERTVIQIHQSQNSGHVISVENGSFRLQVDNTSSYGGFYSSHTGYTQHTDSVSMATGSSLQETQYTQGSSELVTHWRTTPPYCTHGTNINHCEMDRNIRSAGENSSGNPVQISQH